mgnify:CR=1 FL=1
METKKATIKREELHTYLVLEVGDNPIQITLTDELIYQSTSKGYYGKGYLHFHPDVHLEQINEATFLSS